MKAGCYLSLALLTGLILTYHNWLQQFAEPPEVWIAAGVLGLVVWFCLGALWNAWSSGGMIRALSNAQAGITPADGELVAVEGIIQPYGDPVMAPMTDTPCVMYEYEISRRVTADRKTQSVVDFAGLGMAPCEIQTRDAVIALLGFPDIEPFPSEHGGPGTRARAREYVRRTEWEDASGLKVLRGFGAMLQALTSAGEAIRRDFRMVGPSTCPWLDTPGSDEETRQARSRSENYSPSVTEKRISVGERVLAVGKYVAAGPALQTQPGTTFQRVQLLRGTVAEALRNAQASRRAHFVGGLLGLVIVHAIAAGVLWLFCHSAETQSRWKRELAQAIQDSNAAAIERQLNRGLDVNVALDRDLETPLMRTRDVEIARLLISRGAALDARDRDGNTPLMLAARNDRAEVVKLLLESGADLNLVRESDQSTALVQADQSGSHAAAQLLRDAGARDERVTAENGRPVDVDHPAFQVCAEYIGAIHQKDLVTLERLSVIWSKEAADSIDWGAMQGARPVEPELDEGFANGTDATVQVSGPTPAGFVAIWRFQLRFEVGNWKVLRERWDTDGLMGR